MTGGVLAMYRSYLKESCLPAARVEQSGRLKSALGQDRLQKPILKSGYHVTAVEVGGRLADYVRQKFAAYPNFHVLNVAFEGFAGMPDTYDLIYSATAFHWIPEQIGYLKALELLKSGGTLALFWNHPFVNRSDDALHMQIQRIYQTYRPSSAIPAEFRESGYNGRLELLKYYGFVNCDAAVFRRTRIFSSEDYIGLLNTYSDHRAMEEGKKMGLEQEIADVIRRFGGMLRLYDTIDLYLAQKP